MAAGKSGASPRYFRSAPVRLSAAPTSTPNVSRRTARRKRARETATRGPSQRALDRGRASRLGEDDHAVAWEQHVFAVGEDRRSIPDDGADQRPRHRQVAKAPVHELALGAYGDVENLVAVALEHRDL